MEYKELKSGISTHLNNAAEDFFMVGYFLRQISENALFVEDGYKSIWEFAKGEYGLSTSSASRFMAINARFSIDGGEHMAQKYIGMGVSKLQEMLSLPDEELEKVTQETTVREIRAMKATAKEPLSFFGFHKTVRPEGSLITIAGCGDGKYDCFSCCHPCSIRQEPRQCVVSTCGNPKPCDLLDNEEWQKRMGYSLYKDECQMLHHELAPIREGDKEPSPCCRNCENKTCFNRCDVAKAEDEEAKKKAQQELRRQQQEAEAKKPEPSDRDIKAFYDHEHIKPTDTLTAAAFKDKLRNAGCGGGGFDYQGSARGIRINHKREITWTQLTKRLKEIQEKELQQREKETGVTGRSQEKEPDVIDADFREVEDEPKDDPAQEAAEARDEREELEDKEDLLCDDCANASTLTGNVDLCANCGPEGRNYQQAQENTDIAEPDPEHYEPFDVWNLLMDHQKDLQAYREAGMPDNLMQKQRILTDALELLYSSIKEAGEDE